MNPKFGAKQKSEKYVEKKFLEKKKNNQDKKVKSSKLKTAMLGKRNKNNWIRKPSYVIHNQKILIIIILHLIYW